MTDESNTSKALTIATSTLVTSALTLAVSYPVDCPTVFERNSNPLATCQNVFGMTPTNLTSAQSWVVAVILGLLAGGAADLVHHLIHPKAA